MKQLLRVGGKQRGCGVLVDVERRAARAQMLVQMGEISAGRQALEGADLAPANQATFTALTDNQAPTARAKG